MSIVIKVENIGKQYRIGQVGTGTISHDLNLFWHKLRGKENPYLKIGEENDRTKKSNGNLVWALKDINFEVKEGEVLGIIGKNGAGKSTLLKILSQVTSPTTGEIKVKGHIASLLEIGTGFHPELTGRENVFLNGAILGMSKFEINSKFEEIVEFSGVANYIDTPVKRYSSGMLVRLGFAVAAHLEPEILIVDEVLAVGDAEFQKKCLGKMKDIAVHGRTVLFVSHDISAIKRLTSNVLLIENGKVDSYGIPNEIIGRYLGKQSTLKSSYDSEDKQEKKIYFKNIYFSDIQKNPKNEFLIDEDFLINFKLVWNSKFLSETSIIICFLDNLKRKIFSCLTTLEMIETFGLKVNRRQLTKGIYSIQAILYRRGVEQYENLDDICEFSIVDLGSEFDGLSGFDYGVVFSNYEWIK